MKIIFLQDIPRVGQRGQVKDVAPGFANSLISKKLAERATPNAIKKIEEEKKINKKNKEQATNDFKTLLNKVKSLDLTVSVKANGKGHLFKAVSKTDILSILKEKTSIDLEEKNIEIENIKNVGPHKVTIINGEDKGEFIINVLG